jgi:hypothetical protein
MAALVSVAAVALIALAVSAVRMMRRQALARLRNEWGQPVRVERKMAAIAAAHASRQLLPEAPPALDSRTWADLDMDAVFAVLDRTASTLGQHALYHRLRSAPVAVHLDPFTRLVARFAAEPRIRERAQLALARLRDPHGYDLWWLAGPQAISTHAWYAIFPCFTIALLLLVGLIPFWPGLLPALVPMLVLNAVVRYATDRHIGPVAAAFRQLAPVIATAEKLQFLDDDDVRPLIGAIRRDTRSLRRLKLIARWISGDPLMLPAESGPLVVLVNDVVSAAYEYLNFALLLDANGVCFGSRALRTHAPALLRVVAAMGEVDAAISIASFRAGQQEWTQPVFRPPGTAAHLTDLRHPLVPDAVPNSIVLAPGRGVLVTGSNMSGKSTFLRTVGVSTVLAQTVGTCLASAYDAPVFAVRSAIGRSDDLLTGRSYYIAEVESLMALVEASSGAGTCLFLLDELFRGTNAVERIAAGQAVLEHLVCPAGQPSPHVALAATHDGELVELLAAHYTSCHFGDAVVDDGLVFDHRLRPGAASTRNAIALLRLYGAPPTLVRQALESAQRLDAERRFRSPAGSAGG